MSEVNKAAETDKKDSDQAETTAITQVKEKQPNGSWLYRVGKAHQGVWQAGMDIYLILMLVFLIVEIGYDFPTRLNAFNWLDKLPVMAKSFMAYLQENPLIILVIIAINLVTMTFSVLAAYGRSAENIDKETDAVTAMAEYKQIASYEKALLIIQGFIQLILVLLAAVIFFDQRFPMVHHLLATRIMSNISIYNISLFAIPLTIAISYYVFADNMTTGMLAKKKNNNTESEDKKDEDADDEDLLYDEDDNENLL